MVGLIVECMITLSEEMTDKSVYKLIPGLYACHNFI